MLTDKAVVILEQFEAMYKAEGYSPSGGITPDVDYGWWMGYAQAILDLRHNASLDDSNE